MSEKDSAPKRTSRSPLYTWARFLIWPIAVLVILAMFRDPLSDLIRHTTKVKVMKDKNGTIIAEIAANLGAAEATRPRTTDIVGRYTVLDAVTNSATSAASTRSPTLSEAKILWVDDNPDNNRYERRALEALGVQFQLATTAEEALGLMSKTKFNVVISDFSRRDDPKAGYTLLDEMKKLPFAPPLIIYSSPADPQHETEAKSRGAYAETSSPQRLFDFVVNALVSK